MSVSSFGVNSQKNPSNAFGDTADWGDMSSSDSLSTFLSGLNRGQLDESAMSQTDFSSMSDDQVDAVAEQIVSVILEMAENDPAMAMTLLFSLPPKLRGAVNVKMESGANRDKFQKMRNSGIVTAAQNKGIFCEGKTLEQIEEELEEACSKK